MRAVITGTPVTIEGEPAEIAQLVELLSAGAVMVEHVHHWKLDPEDESGVAAGRCWCGQERAFAPYGVVDVAPATPGVAHTNGAKPVAVATTGRKCSRCGLSGHTSRKCQVV